MRKRVIVVLGVPIDCLGKEEAVTAIFSLLEKGDQAKRPFFVRFVSRDILVDFNSWRLDEMDSLERHQLFFQADLSVGFDPFFSKVSALLGDPWKPSFDEKELIFSLLDAFEEKGKKVFLLGTDIEKNRAWIKYISVLYPNLSVATMDIPNIPLEDISLKAADERDDAILEEIRKHHSDILLLDFGQPNHDIWFDRVRYRLSVPLVISIGCSNTLEVRHVKVYSQVLGYKTKQMQPPKKGIFKQLKRSLTAFFKLFFIVMPLALYHSFSRILVKSFCERHTNVSAGIKKSMLFLSDQRTLAVVVMPVCLDQSNCLKFEQIVEELIEHDIVILDCRAMRHLDLEGIFSLINCLIIKGKERVIGMGVSSHISFLLDLHNVWELIRHKFYRTPKEVESLLRDKPSAVIYDSIHQSKDEVMISFFGMLHSHCDYSLLLNRYIAMIRNKDCLLNFSYCTTLSNAAMVFLLKLLSYQTEQQKKFTVCGLSKELRRELRLAKMDAILTKRMR